MQYNLELYKPHTIQEKIHKCPSRFIVASWGRQSGKTSCAINFTLDKAWTRPGTKYWIVEPTKQQARRTYRRLVSMLWINKDIMIKNNKTELRIKFINHSEIMFVSGEVYQNLRGETLDGVVLDEVRELPHDLWPLVIRPMLATTNGWALFISTPNGFDYFYDLATLAQADTSKEKTWSFFAAPSTGNPLFTQQEFEESKKQMSDKQFRQEILAEFLDLTKGKTYVYSSLNKRTETPFATTDPMKQVVPYSPVILGLDFNVDPMAWTLLQTNNDSWYAFDELFVRNTNTQEVTKALIEKLHLLKARNLLKGDPQIIICGDATGESRKTSATETDYAIITSALKQNGFTFSNITPRSNPAIKSRINNMNAKLCAADGAIKFFVNHVMCQSLDRDLTRVTWKADGILDEGNEKLLTHISDSVGYPVSQLTPIESMNDVGTMGVIRR